MVYSSRTPRIPLEAFQEEMRKRAASGSSASPSTAPLAPIPSPIQPTDNVSAFLCFEYTVLHRHEKTTQTQGQSLGFYQFSTRGLDCRMRRSLPTSNREWKKEFFFISGPWTGDLVEVLSHLQKLCHTRLQLVEDATPLQTRPNVPKMLKMVPTNSLEKRKAVSRTVDIGNLPSHRGQKRPKVDSSSHSKAPIVKLNPSLVENPAVVLPSEVPSSKDPSRPNLELSTIPLVSASYTFLRSETLA
ncbi:hypothetical protein SO802_002528 [Lithocarpus litseifolius]|uniref:Uncharacterized protein n=1 Tax=Lithocarpus litseifolius TaxID=425828 RepID=A0AAW2E197_9ROSI